MAGNSAEWIRIPDGNGGLKKIWLRDSTARRDIASLNTDVAGKQDALSTAQLNAVNSGITAVKVATYDAISVPSASSTTPAMDGTGAAGSSNDYARADHVHPSDTAKQDALSQAQLDAANSGITAEIVGQILPYLGQFTGNINSPSITPGIYYLLGFSITLSGGTTSFYGTFIQFPGTYKVQMVIGGPSGAGGIIESRRYLTNSSSFTNWA